MKYHVKYTYTLEVEKIIDAETEEEAETLIQKESRELIFAENKKARRDYEVMPYGIFTFDTTHALLINGVPVRDNQTVLVKYGKGEPTGAKMKYDATRNAWEIDYRDFIGHTYLNKPVTNTNVSLFIVVPIEVEHE